MTNNRMQSVIRLLGVVFVALGALGVQDLAAQTPEGTVITNTARVTYTDANGNAYDPVDGVVTVTVGFTAGIDVLAGAAEVTPDAPSTDNLLSFTIENLGNGADTVQVAGNNTNSSLVTNVRFVFESVTYGSIAELNAALGALEIPGGGSIEVGILYDVPAGMGGLSGRYELTATSVRDGTKTDTDGTDILSPMSGSIVVTPDGGQNVERLPSNGTQYTATFTIENQQTGTDSLTLVATSPGSAIITIVSVNGVAGSTADLASIAASAQAQVNVVYTIDNAALAGAQDTLVLTATSKTNGSVVDDGFFDITVVRPALSITKAAFRDDQSTQITGSDRVVPGEAIQYRITVENTGTADAVSVEVNDVLPAQLTYDSASGDGGTPAWDLSETGGTVTATLPTPLAPGASRVFWIRVIVN